MGEIFGLRVRHMNEVRRRPESQLLILVFLSTERQRSRDFETKSMQKDVNEQIVFMDMGLISWQHSSVVTQATSEEDTDRSTVSTVTCMTRDNDHQKPVIQHQQVCFRNSLYGKSFILCAMAWYGMCSILSAENSLLDMIYHMKGKHPIGTDTVFLHLFAIAHLFRVPSSSQSRIVSVNMISPTTDTPQT